MEILTYRELKSKDDLLPLMDHAFRWPFNPRWYEDFVKIDPRMKNGPVGFCAVENGRVVGFVGVLDMATRTLNRKVERVGGIYGVATLPSHVRKGISTILMNRAHGHFKEKGYRFSFLGTSRTIVAHDFYKKLCYKDILDYPSAYKVIEQKKAKPLGKEKPKKFDLDKILKIYNEFSKDRVGFAFRNRAHMEMLKKAEGLTVNHCIIDEEGYVFFRREGKGILIRELVALNALEMRKLIDLMEGKAKDLVYDRAVLDDRLHEIYRSLGYMTRDRSHSVMMVKTLTDDASFKKTYGDEFYMAGLDYF